MVWIAAAAIWVVCGVLVYGIECAWSQEHWPSKSKEDWRKECGFAIFLGCFGPITLFVNLVFMDGTKHGLKFRFSERM